MGIVSDNLTLPKNIENEQTTITYESNNKDVLTNEGIFTRPYNKTKVTYTVTISDNLSSIKKTYEVDTVGFKSLDNIASGYVYTNYNNLTNKLYETLDIINCAFTKIDSNLQYDSVSKLETYRDIIIPKAHKNGIYVLLSIEPHSSYSYLTNKENNMLDSFTNKLIELVNLYGFDGIDIDWEVPKKGEEQQFTLLMENLYNKIKLNNKNHLVTAAIGGGKWQPPMYDLSNSKNYIDYINIMLYDMSSASGQYQNALYPSKTKNDEVNNVGFTLTSCSADETVKFLKNNYQIEYSKLLIGIPFYGRKQVLENNEWVKDSAPSYTTIRNTILPDTTNYTYVFDNIAKVPYIISNDGKTFISYEDETSISNKCMYIKENNLAGMMYWQNGQDTTDTLLNAIKVGLKD